MEKVKFNYSQSEIVAYLITKGYTYCDVFVKENNRYKGSKKVFFTFEGQKDELIKLSDEFNNGTSNINLKEYINNLMEVKKTIAIQLSGR